MGKKAMGLGPKATRPSYSKGQGHLANPPDVKMRTSPGTMKGQGSGKGSGQDPMNSGKGRGGPHKTVGSKHANAMGQTAGKGGLKNPFGHKDTKP